jgi:hypothetical protein
MLLVLFGTLILCVAGCGGAPEAQKASEAAPPPPPKPAEEKVELYELTKDNITDHKDWTSRNIAILGTKIGDKTNDVAKNLGAIVADTKEYLTIHQNNGLFVYTFGPTGRIRRFEVYETFAKKVADAKLQKLLTSGDLKLMRELFGMEEGEAITNAEEMSTEYPYDSRGFRFVKFKVSGQTVNAIRLVEFRKSST